MFSVRDKVYLAGWIARVYVGKYPRLFHTLYASRRWSRIRAVNRTTQLVIEGYPRSANTFAEVAFRQAQRDSVRIAHHLHAPAQIIRAAQWQIPTIVLIREPTDAVLSYVVRHPQISVSHALRAYISFYRTVARFRSAYVVGTFREVTEDYGAVIQRVNAKFGTHFALFEHTEANVEKVFTIVEYLNKRNVAIIEALHKRNVKDLEAQVARPSAAKDRLKAEARSALESKKAKALLGMAEEVYCDFASHADRQTLV
jgi:hypothetical protein